MDEPMDEMCEADSTQSESENVEQRQPVSSPLLRAGSMGMYTNFCITDPIRSVDTDRQEFTV